MARILAIRFAALGDVAIALPVLYSFAAQYPEHELIFLSNKRFETLFIDAPPNFKFVGADLKGEHRTIWGLFKLFKQTKALKIDAVADIHNVLRSQVVRFFFFLSGVKTAARKKDRRDRKQLIRRNNKVLKELKSYHQRFAEVFYALGYKFPLNFSKPTMTPLLNTDGKIWLGIAPFAANEWKMYPLELMEQVVSFWSNKNNVNVFLFGGGKSEETILSAWEKKYPNTVSIAGKYNLKEELGLMQQLDVMLSMDSANMHLASLVGTSVLSVWGATHPYVGFRPWNQPKENQIQLDLPCRPCSEWGRKPCYLRHYGCMRGIAPKQIINKIAEIINK